MILFTRKYKADEVRPIHLLQKKLNSVYLKFFLTYLGPSYSLTRYRIDNNIAIMAIFRQCSIGIEKVIIYRNRSITNRETNCD